MIPSQFRRPHSPIMYKPSKEDMEFDARRHRRNNTMEKLFLSEMVLGSTSEKDSHSTVEHEHHGVQVPHYKRKHRFSMSESRTHVRLRGDFFNEKSIATRPDFFTQEMIDGENQSRRKELVECAEQIFLSGTYNQGESPACIIRHHDKITGIGKRLCHLRAPPSSVKVQWRQGKVHKVPTLQLAFLLLNRTSPVVALVRMNSNSALCVFETISGASKVVGTWGCQQGSRLLILSWWYPQFAQANERKKVSDDKWSTTAWLSEELFVMKKSYDGTLNQSITFKDKALPKPFVEEIGGKKPKNPVLDPIWRHRNPMELRDRRYTMTPAITANWEKITNARTSVKVGPGRKRRMSQKPPAGITTTHEDENKDGSKAAINEDGNKEGSKVYTMDSV